MLVSDEEFEVEPGESVGAAEGIVAGDGVIGAADEVAEAAALGVELIGAGAEGRGETVEETGAGVVAGFRELGCGAGVRD